MELLAKLQSWDKELEMTSNLIEKKIVMGCQDAVKENYDD